MKCPECSYNHKYALGMRCGCGYDFVLDPKRDGYADGRLIAAARKASAGDTLYYTFPQLATTVVGMRPNLLWQLIPVGIMLTVAALLLFLSINGAVVGFLGAVGLFLAIAALRGHSRLDVAQLRRAVNTYQVAKGQLKFLLRDDSPLAKPPRDWPEKDLYDYGVEGILIVARPVLVDLFVLNGLHSANRILVVSESGYPEYVVSHVNRILDEQPSVPVFALHDATADGAAMTTRLTDSKTFHLRDHQIRDLGLNKSDLQRTPKLRRFASNGEVVVDHLRWSRLSSGVAASIVGGTMLVDVIGHDPEASLSIGFG